MQMMPLLEWYQYDSVQINFPFIGVQLRKWMAQRFTGPATRHPVFRVEDNTHITVLYGLDTKNQLPWLSQAIDEFPKPQVLGQFGPIKRFETPSYDVLYISIYSEDLKRLNKAVRKYCAHTSLHPKYIPHMTLAYVPKGEFKELDGQVPVRGAFAKETMAYYHRGKTYFLSINPMVPAGMAEALTEGTASRATFERRLRMILKDRLSRDEVDKVINDSLRAFDFAWVYSGDRGLSRISADDFMDIIDATSQKAGVPSFLVRERLKSFLRAWSGSQMAFITKLRSLL